MYIPSSVSDWFLGYGVPTIVIFIIIVVEQQEQHVSTSVAMLAQADEASGRSPEGIDPGTWLHAVLTTHSIPSHFVSERSFIA